MNKIMSRWNSEIIYIKYEIKLNMCEKLLILIKWDKKGFRDNSIL